MKTNWILFCSALIFAFRLFLSLSQSNAGTVSGLVICLSGLIACGTTLSAWSSGRPQLNWQAVGIAMFYLLPIAYQPGNVHLEIFGPFFWCLFVVQCWVRWRLGRRTTVTGSVYVSLYDRAPYGLIRHPMTFVEILMGFCFTLEFPSLWNFLILLLCFTSKLVIVCWEENFLNEHESYRLYARRVPWRLIPKIW